MVVLFLPGVTLNVRGEDDDESLPYPDDDDEPLLFALPPTIRAEGGDLPLLPPPPPPALGRFFELEDEDDDLFEEEGPDASLRGLLTDLPRGPPDEVEEFDHDPDFRNGFLVVVVGVVVPRGLARLLLVDGTAALLPRAEDDCCSLEWCKSSSCTSHAI